MAVLPESLTTLAKVKTMLGIPTDVNTDDAYLEDIINAVSIGLQEACGRKFVLRNYNGTAGSHTTTSVSNETYIRFSGKGKSQHCLPQYPIENSGFVLEELASRTDGSESWTTLVENSDYLLDREFGILTMQNGVFNRGNRNYRVTASAGYSSSGAPWVPSDLEHAAKVLVREAYKELDRTTSEKVGDISRSFDISKNRHMVENTINRYTSDANLY